MLWDVPKLGEEPCTSADVFISPVNLTVANLAREAGVSRATANRATAVLVEFRAAEARFRSGSVAGLKARIRELEAELRTARGGEMAELRATIKTLAQQIQILALEGEEQRRLIAVLE